MSEWLWCTNNVHFTCGGRERAEVFPMTAELIRRNNMDPQMSE